MSLPLESLNATKELVATLADKGVALTVDANSPLQELMSATKTWCDKLECLGDIDKLPGSLASTNDIKLVDGVVQEDPHSAYLGAVSSELGRLIAGHVAYSRTVVLPAVGELIAKIKAVMDLEESCGIRSYKVEKVTGSPLFDIASIVSEIDKFGQLSAVREYTSTLDYKDVSDEVLMGLMKNGSDAYDAAIDAFVANEGIETIREVWRVVFQGDNSKYKNFDLFRVDRQKGQARCFATFLIALRLIAGGKDLPEVTGLAGMSSNKYGPALRNLLEVSGTALFHILSFQREQAEQGKLIDRIDNKTVYVNSEVYDRFMNEQDGDIETILGAAISGERKFYVKDLIENVEKYKTGWNYHVAMAKQNAANNMVVNVRGVVFEFIRRYVYATDDEVISTNADLIIKNTNAFCSSIFAPSLGAVEQLALNALSSTVFSHTDAGILLAGVQEAMMANPDIHPDDAMNLSVVDYVAWWVAQMVDTVGL